MADPNLSVGRGEKLSVERSGAGVADHDCR
jgi:hypothetical protein